MRFCRCRASIGRRFALRRSLDVVVARCAHLAIEHRRERVIAPPKLLDDGIARRRAGEAEGGENACAGGRPTRTPAIARADWPTSGSGPRRRQERGRPIGEPLPRGVLFVAFRYPAGP
jgi:hypothetical protein